MVQFTETVIRDANQSLLATRMRLEEFADILPTMDKAGYYSVECWGGATFDACLRFLHEDPWQRLRTIRKLMPNTKLQMLLRGQSLLGYRHYPDDVVRQFVRSSVENGIDILRIFDALNDISNLKVALEETRLCDAHASCAMAYSTSPVHNTQYYVALAQEYVRAGAQSICIKDMAGLLEPEPAYALISALKDKLDCPIILHTHCTTGMAAVTCYNAIRAGVDVIDTATAAFSGGTSQPATQVVARMAEALGQEHGLHWDKLSEIEHHFQGVRRQYQQNNAIAYQATMTNPTILTTQIPGGMYSNLLSQIQGYHLENRMDDLIQEIPAIRKDMGYPPLVTPISQMIGTQALTNLVCGKRYGVVISEIKSYFSGEYGTPPASPDAEVMEKIAGRRALPAGRYAETLAPALPPMLLQHPDWSMEEILTEILFPAQAQAFREYQKTTGDQYTFSENIQPPQALEPVDNDELTALIAAILAYRLRVSPENLKNIAIYQKKEA